jgi:hypothetical protein
MLGGITMSVTLFLLLMLVVVPTVLWLVLKGLESMFEGVGVMLGTYSCKGCGERAPNNDVSVFHDWDGMRHALCDGCLEVVSYFTGRKEEYPNGLKHDIPTLRLK